MAVPAALRHRIFEKLVEKKLVIDVVLMWRTLSSSRYGGLAVTFMIVTTMSGLIEPASVSAAHHPTIRIQLSLVDTSIPGGFYLGDTLRLTVNVTINGRQARTGALYLDTTDRAEPNLCVVAFDPPHSNYCKIDFPNSGRWRIMAKYTLNNTWYTNPRFVATGTLAATIHPIPTTTISYAPQATTTVVSSNSFNQVIAGHYFPQEYATVTVNGEPGASPGGGGVTFTDAAGAVICGTVVSVVATFTGVRCTGAARNTPPVNPVTATYTGTNLGSNDGIGYVYASSSGSAYVY
jgi:hypothetical protein